MGKPSQKQIVTQYRLSVQFGIGVGPVDKFKKLWVDEKLAWSGELVHRADVYIDRLDLFGGIKQGGGIQGVLSFFAGHDNQVLDEYLATRLDLTTANAPAFRGMASFWMTGGTNRFGCVWSYNNPIVAQSVWAEVERAPKGLDPTKAMIGPDANPAHMIYECLTNSDWGMGASPTSLDVPTFTACGETLSAEQFGLSMFWRDQMRIEDFVSEILDHIQGVLYVNPRTGLLTLKLLRDDYDFNSLRVITPDNAKMTSYQRKYWGETVNEIVVTWTNPENEQDETVSIQDLANIGYQGAPVSDSRNYYGVRNAALAERLAARDIRAAAAPLASVDVELDRTAWDIFPGEVVRLDWPEDGLQDIVMRVGRVDYGRPGDPMIKVSLLEDIFSLLKPSPRPSPGTGWDNPAETPRPIDYTQIITLPAFFVTSSDYVSTDFNLTYPEVLATVLAAQDSRDTATFELLTEQVSTTGSIAYETAGTKTIIGRTTLDNALIAEPTSLLPASTIADALRGPMVGGFIFIGNVVDDGGSGATPDSLGLSGDTGELLLSGVSDGSTFLLSTNDGSVVGESFTEIALVEAFDGTNYTLARGVLDTLPRAFPVGTPIWFINPGARFVDEVVIRSEGEVVDYKIQTRTSLGLLPEADAPVETGVMTARPHLPYRPGNVQVNGVGFGDVAVPTGDITITWATRNRELEDTQVMRWTDGPVPPEPQQETVVTVTEPGGVVVYEQTGLWTDTSLVLPASYFARYTYINVQVRSRLNGRFSLQGHSIKVTGLPGNTDADPPPAALPPGPPPNVGPAPVDYNWTVTPTALTSGGTSLPILLVEGSASDNPAAAGILFEIRPIGDSTWNTVTEVPPTTTKFTINQVQGGTNYYVAISYRLNGIFGSRLVFGPITTTATSAPGGGGGTGGPAPESVGWWSNTGRGISRHIAAETDAITIGGAGGKLSVTINASVSYNIDDIAVGTWQLYAVTAVGETQIDSGTCTYNEGYVAGDVVGDFVKLSSKLFDIPSGTLKVRLYISGGGPSTSVSGEIGGTMLAIVYNN